MSTTIADLRAALTTVLDTYALTYGEDNELDATEQNDVSYAIDEANETWNENLPPRPHS